MLTIKYTKTEATKTEFAGYRASLVVTDEDGGIEEILIADLYKGHWDTQRSTRWEINWYHHEAGLVAVGKRFAGKNPRHGDRPWWTCEDRFNDAKHSIETAVFAIVRVTMKGPL